MQPDNKNQPYSGTAGEKVIQPLNPNLPTTATPNIVKPNNPAPVPTTSIMPGDTEHRVPSLDLSKSLLSGSQRLSIQHKSLMGLAIVGLISTAFLAYSCIELNSAINNAINEGKNIGSAQLYLYISWASVAVSLAINIYFLMAKSVGTTALLLKIILVFELLGLLNQASGIGSHDVLGFVFTGAYVIYVFVVLSVIKTPQAI